MIRAAISTASFRLRAGWKVAALMTAVGASALAVLFIGQSVSSGDQVAGTTLAITSPAQVGDALNWTSGYKEAGALQNLALKDLLLLLLGAGWVALVTALVTIVTRAAAQAAIRRGDVAVRRAVGASKASLRLALVIEVGVIAALMMAGALLLGYAGTRIGVAMWPGPGDLRFTPGIGFLLLAFAAAMTLVLWIGANLRENIAHQEEAEVPLTLPAAQLGIGLAVLVAGSLVLGRAAEITRSVNQPGSETGSIVGLRLSDAGPEERAQRYGVLLDSLSGMDDVKIVSLTNAGAQSGLGVMDMVTTDCGQCVEGTIILRFHNFKGLHQFVSPDTFKAHHIQLLEGRAFTRDDDWDAPRVAVVGRHLAYRHFQGGDAVGRDIFVASGWPGRPYKVIGIVDDPPVRGLNGAERPISNIFLSVLQHPPVSSELLIRPAEAHALRGLSGVVTEAERAHEEAGPLKWFAFWFGVAGWVILGIAVVGTFTMLRLWVRSRAAELGVRRSVGATRVRIVLFVIRRTIMVAIAGVALGLFLLGSIVRPSLGDLFVNLPAWNPGLVILLSLLLSGVAVAGAMIPTWRLLRGSTLTSSSE